MNQRWRLYVDESGDHTYRHLEDASRRYLGLTGIAIEAEYYRTEFHPAFEALKQKHFPHSPDEPLVLHRDDLINRRKAFNVLQDVRRNTAWETDLVAFVNSAQFTLITVVFDKKPRYEEWGDAAWHPYHTALGMLLERYCGRLLHFQDSGDVLAESRGGREDMALKAEYERLYEYGTYYFPAQRFQRALTTRQLKLKKKTANTAGLQLADLLAHPSKQGILLEKQRTAGPGPFGQRLCEVIQTKYNRQICDGRAWGYGKVLI